jgi:hypothetical protein
MKGESGKAPKAIFEVKKPRWVKEVKKREEGNENSQILQHGNRKWIFDLHPGIGR